ncbi:MAG: AmmeMemoRadiSam system protein B [Nitrospirota bacterium]|nr:MAG: AmmeMemoRadiSam system protein B [Nitrospirota bacterium]
MGTKARVPAVAGQFYNADPGRLRRQIDELIDRDRQKNDCIAALSPHAGFMYSGPVAGAVYSSINIPENVLLIGPNHTGRGARASIMTEGIWRIPFGEMSINGELATMLADQSDLLEVDSAAHVYEHSLEVQLPFIYTFRPEVRIVPITLMGLSLEECDELGRCIAGIISSYEEAVLIIASSDMSHYVSDETARKLDREAIKRLLDIDPEGLYDVVKRKGISMCGYIPATVMLYAARYMEAGEAALIKYTTSAETSGDYDHVVGYAGVLVGSTWEGSLKDVTPDTM